MIAVEVRERFTIAEQLAEMQKIIDAEKSDIFDVLAYVAYAMPTVRRDERAANARVKIHQTFGAKQQAFLEFVLQHYVSVWEKGSGKRGRSYEMMFLGKGVGKRGRSYEMMFLGKGPIDRKTKCAAELDAEFGLKP